MSRELVSRRFRAAAVLAVLAVLPVGVIATPAAAAPASPAASVQAVVNQQPTSAAGMASDPTGATHVFYRGLDARVYYRTFTNGVWSSETLLGLQIVGTPAAARYGSTLIVAARGRDNAQWIRTRTGTSWGPWQSLGGVLHSSPAIVTRGDGEVTVFHRGTTNSLYAKTKPAGGTWPANWVFLGNTLTTGPAAMFSAGGADLEVYAFDGAHNLARRVRTGSGWGPWEGIGGQSYSAPAVTWNQASGTATVLVRGLNDALYSRQRTAAGWGAYQNRGGVLVDAPGATGTSSGGIDVVTRGTTNSFYAMTLRNGVWSGNTRAWFPAARPGPAASLLGNDWTRIPTTAKVVALTFDAGANANALPSILQTLRTKNVAATFFITGQWVQNFPAEANAITVGGYVVANHSVSHPDMRTLTDAQAKAEVTVAQQLILEANGADTRPIWRFPLGAVDSRVMGLVNGLGYVAVRWTVDTLGWQGTSGGQSAQTVLTRVMNTLQPGQIVLMHVGSHPTDGSMLDAAALPQMIDQIRAQGYSFVTLEALVGP